jgi:Flp pilus assembly protein TadG
MKKSDSAERGASAVEMAMVAPFLLILLLGIIEFGFVFGQYNEVRHSAREGARYAAVGNPDRTGDGNITSADVIDAVCDTLNLPGATVGIVTTISGSGEIGDEATLAVTLDIESISGAPIISSFVPDDLANTATFRLEQDAQWSAFSDSDAC